MSEVKFCKEFIQQLSKYPVEYLEGYVEKKKSSAKPVPAVAAAKPKTTPAPAASDKTGAALKASLKKLGGAGKAHEVPLNAGAKIATLRTEAARIFGTDSFSLMYKGRPLSDDEALVSSVITDPSTAVYVCIKAGGAKTEGASSTGLPEEFWGDFEQLLAKHLPAADKRTTFVKRFKQDHTQWL